MTLDEFNSASTAQLDAEVIRMDRRAKLGDLRFKYELLDDLGNDLPNKRWLIKNIVAMGETSAWIAPPGGLKSALLAELSFNVAAQLDWHGYKAKISGPVVYFALERTDLVKRRLRPTSYAPVSQKRTFRRSRSCPAWWIS